MTISVSVLRFRRRKRDVFPEQSAAFPRVPPQWWIATGGGRGSRLAPRQSNSHDHPSRGYISGASRVGILCLISAALGLSGCIKAKNSFRINSAATLHDRILFPPGAEISHGKLDLYVETHTLRCKKALPTRTSDWVTISNPYWSAAGSRVLRIEVAGNALPGALTPPPAQCLNVAVRPASEPCPQNLIVDQLWSAIEKDEDWGKCFLKDPLTKRQLTADVSQVLPHRASESGALREERTYARAPESAPRVGALAASSPRAAAAALDAEVVSLLPGAELCVNREHTLADGSATAWVASAQSCAHLLDAPEGGGRVVLSRTDTEYTFPNAWDFYSTAEAKIYEARSWLAIRGALAALMHGGAFLYLYYSGNGKHNIPTDEVKLWEDKEHGSLRVYPSVPIETPIRISPILVAHSEPLVLGPSMVPDLNALCMPDRVNGKLIQRRCFAFRDFSSIDVLRPFSVDGRVHFAPSGTLTTDIPEITVSRRPVATRVFRGRRVPMDFDVSNAQNAVPLAAGDQFGGRR